MELPLVIQELVDDLQPLLTPYAATFYRNMFRHSIAESGMALVRVSTRELQVAVVKSSYSSLDKSTISWAKVRETLSELESIGAIRNEGEPDREGTPYRVLVPDEIEACRKFRTERLAKEKKPEISEEAVDYYNVRENRIKIFERDEYNCRYCGKQLTRFTATLDHVRPVAEGGDNSLDNLVTACLTCNSRKNRRLMGDFFAEQGH